MADHLGNLWSLWPPSSLRGMNLVSRERSISSLIISVCLTRKGELPLHPDFGLAPELFDPLSDYRPQYFIYQLREEVLKWVAGIEQISVQIPDYEDYKNRIEAQIRFRAVGQSAADLLVFDFYQYQGAIYRDNVEPFLQSITLNTTPLFSGLDRA